MTQEEQLSRLELILGISEDDADTDLLTAYLEDASDEMRLYLAWTESEWEELPDALARKIVQLAAIFYRQETAEAQASGLSKLTTTEEKLSQSAEYRTPEDWSAQQTKLLNSLARYRRVGVRNVAVSET
ncbi:MAG: phage head-tail connector protein [Oscillospiraceae bacterium]|nr:phage head-tail connector protein [Oscillospiraceae bacterium]